MPGRVPRALVLAAALGAAATAGAQDAGLDARLSAGVRLHDEGRYDQAIAVYREVLAKHPGHPRASYELAYTTYRKGDLPAAIAVLEEARRTPAAILPEAYVLLGIAYDDRNEWAKAEAILREGLARTPGSRDLHFNLGVNLAFGQKKVDDGVHAFEAALRQDARHPGSWLRLAQTEESRGRKPRAFVAFVRFLTLEPESPRSKDALAGVQRLWQAGVSRGPDQDGKAQIQVEVPSPQDVGEEAAAEAMVFALAASVRHLKENESLDDDAAFPLVLEKVLVILRETSASKPGAAFLHETLGYFEEARAAGHLGVLAWDIRRASGDPAVERWLAANAAAVDRYRIWDLAWDPAVSPRP